LKDLHFDFAPSSLDVKLVVDSLELSNSKHINIESTPFSITVKDDGKIIAGIDTFTKWGLLMVDILWVSEDYRGQGLGIRLMNEAENFAVSQGCSGIELYTMSFQAESFYKKLGFSKIGQVDNCYSGASKIYMFKELKK